MSPARNSFPSRRQAGFTLLEMLIATAVGAIVLLVISTTFFSALRLRDTTHASIDHDLVIQRALAIVRRDLAGLMLPAATQTANTLAGPLQTDTFVETSLDGGGGERVTPDFFTNSGRIDGWTQFADAQAIAYYLTPDDNGGPNRNLVRLVTRNLLTPSDLPATSDAQVILQDVISAGLQFYDGSGWVDVWNSTDTSTLPSALKFSLIVAARDGQDRIAPAPIELVVPVLVKTTTTAEEEAAAGT